jgi:hypothetical protein
MTDKIYTSTVQMEKFIQSKITKALMASSRRITYQLRQIIDEQYYNDPHFYPNIYKRTNQFLDSASYQLIGINISQIGINMDEMHYKNIDSDDVVKYASKSMHGSPLFQTNTKDFWTSFESWCDDNIVKILKEELINQGLKIIS